MELFRAAIIKEMLQAREISQGVCFCIGVDVTGKRFFAHNGGDPGAKDASLMYWFEVKKKKGSAPQFIAHEIVAGRNTGIGTQFQCIDFNKDGNVDIALSNKKGVNLLIQK